MPAAKSGVRRLRSGTARNAASKRPLKKTVPECLARKQPGVCGRAIAHRGKFEEFPPEQVAVNHKERDQIHARNQQQEKRNDVADDDDAQGIFSVPEMASPSGRGRPAGSWG